MGIADVISLLGGIALFLYGMAVMGDNLKKVAGSKLELVLYKLSGTPLKGVLLGTAVTAVIQSSSASVGISSSRDMRSPGSVGRVGTGVPGVYTAWMVISAVTGAVYSFHFPSYPVFCGTSG